MKTSEKERMADKVTADYEHAMAEANITNDGGLVLVTESMYKELAYVKKLLRADKWEVRKWHIEERWYAKFIPFDVPAQRYMVIKPSTVSELRVG